MSSLLNFILIPHIDWLLALAILAGGLALAWRYRQKRQRERLQRTLWDPMATHLETFYRGLVTTRAPIVELHEEDTGWRPVLPPFGSDPRPEWQAQAKYAPDLFTAYQQFVDHYVQIADELMAWLQSLAGELTAKAADLAPHIRFQASAAAFYLYLRLNGMTQAVPEWNAAGQLKAGQLRLAEALQGMNPQEAEALAGAFSLWLREQLNPYLRFRDRITKLQVTHDRLLHHLRALGQPLRPFGQKHVRAS